jgi:hypothetical protein
MAVCLFGGIGCPLPVAAHNFIGAQRCASCHAFEFEVWEHSAHAKSHLALSAEQLKDSKCNTCHTNVQDADPKFAGVQCEQCHGAGKYYQPTYVMKDHDLSRAVGLLETPPNSCQACHTAGTPSVVPFDYKSQWAPIDHGKQARLAWEKAHSKPVTRPAK